MKPGRLGAQPKLWHALPLVLLAILGHQPFALGQDCNGTATTCSTCIGSGPECAWCADSKEHAVRCRSGSQWQVAANPACDVAELQDPQPSVETVQPVVDFGEQVQVRPQRFRLKLRPGSSREITFKVRPAANYPLDVYYLMDLSGSMSDDLTTLIDQSTHLAAAIRTVSTNSDLGFGAFVEKPMEPFSLAYGPRVLQPCAQCTVPYSFRNVVPLTQNLSRFTDQLRSISTSSNIDEPEDSLTGLVQAAACTTEIGWKSKSRKVVVVATDAGYHVAGEGSLAGIILPNDGLCHMVNNEYTESRVMDYPSVGLVKRVLEENRVSTIFAVTENAKPVYEALAAQLPGSNVVLLTSDSSNAVQLLREELARQISVTNLTVIPHNGGVTINASAVCPVVPQEIGPHGLPLCRNMSVNIEAEFTVSFTGTTCEKLNNLKQVTLRIQGFDDVIVDIESLCRCPCEDEEPVQFSPHCSKAGNETCGSCDCYPGYRSVDGGRCNCNETLGDAPCIEPGSNVVCSGEGVCECMKCRCIQDETNPARVVCGQFCNCHNQMCPTFEGQICGGPTRGVCPCESCGKCRCEPGYTGEDCSCPLSSELCTKEGEQRPCSSEGTCHCGVCNCTNGYTGRFCDVCRTGEICSSICDRSSVCQTCSGTSGQCQICNSRARQTYSAQTQGGDTAYLIDGVQATACQQDCSSRYFVAQDANGRLTSLHIDHSTDTCPTSINYIPIILGIIFGMLLLGILALILWKLWARWRDRNEYQDFLKNRNDTMWGKDESPIFEPPVKTYDNPQYAAAQQAKAEAADAEQQTTQEATSNF